MICVDVDGSVTGKFTQKFTLHSGAEMETYDSLRKGRKVHIMYLLVVIIRWFGSMGKRFEFDQHRLHSPPRLLAEKFSYKIDQRVPSSRVPSLEFILPVLVFRDLLSEFMRSHFGRS